MCWCSESVKICGKRAKICENMKLCENVGKRVKRCELCETVQIGHDVKNILKGEITYEHV